MALQLLKRRITHAHLFCGLGSGAAGFNDGEARVGSIDAEFECLGGIDNDPAAIRDFDRIAGVRGTLRDLFSAEQYRAFHGRSPPADWREASPADVQAAFQHERPDIIFLSAPCKGFSGLLAETTSLTDKYQALNALTLRGVWLALEAYQGDPVPLFVFENVPRIATRGRPLLDHIQALFRAYGYIVAESAHDCGEIADPPLSQSRKRFLMVARHAAKVPNFLYEPPKRTLRGVGEVLGRMWLPGDPRGGPMHRVPALQWKTWVRLAFVEAGKDWRSLNRLTVEDGVLRDYGIVPEPALHNTALGVVPWADPRGTILGESFPTNGRFAVQDPRTPEWQADVLGVRRWDEATGVEAGRSTPTNGAYAVADPREGEGRHHGAYGVQPWEEPSNLVTSGGRPSHGVFSVADPRVDGHAKSVQLGVRPWDQPAPVVKGDVSVGTGPYAVADPRLQGGPRFNHLYRIVPWAQAGGSVTSAHGGMAAVADPRGADGRHVNGKYRVTPFDGPANAVIGGSTTGNGAYVVADPRGVGEADEQHGKYRVTEFVEPTRAVIAGRDNGAFAVADPRPEGMKERQDRYMTQGHYGVVDWQDPSRAVTAAGQVDNGSWAVADPRGLPAPEARLVCIIRALDDTWHRPFTTLELAALQSLYDPDDYAESGANPFTLDGASDSGWRERIGNAVPRRSAKAIASVMGKTLLLADAGETFALSAEPIWVRPLAIALSVDTGTVANG